MAAKTREDEIDEYLDDLREIWLRAPDLRLGQLIANLATPNMSPGNGEQRFCAVFYISDHRLLRTGVWWEKDGG